VLVAGHSLGGGVALIAGAWAALQWPAADVQVVTLGSPMPGNAQFAEVRAQPSGSLVGPAILLELQSEHGCKALTT
jgi:Lipase (class 3)